ncbi:MAG: RnfABCDGE type electron transport complex subunit G [Clostridium sp.]
MAGKSGFMKDALILFAITLISGILLGGVYEVTKEPIKQATIAANNATYKEVFPEADSFKEDPAMADKISECNSKLETESYGAVGVEQVMTANDAGGTAVGYVINTYSNDSYGGKIQVSVGLKEDGTVTAIGFLSINDTPGLGLKAKEPAFKEQYNGKNAESLAVVKGGGAGDAEINAISGATISSKATTNSVNAALYFLHNYLN